MKNDLIEQSKTHDEVEALSELLRIGKDEMNLAEFPMTLLSDRSITGETSLKFEDEIYDDRKKRLIIRKRIIEGSREYGLPTATDDTVILGLIQLTKLKNSFTAREVAFTRHELINLLGWPNKGQSYDRITQSLHRLASVTYHFENSWWDNRRKAWTTKIFGIIDTVELNDSREINGQGNLFHSQIIWNQIIFDSFQAGYLRSIDFNTCINLKHYISKRIYRFMGKRFHLRSEWIFDLKDFACEHIGLSRTYEGGTQIARKLKPALAELEAIGFLESLPENERFFKRGQNWLIRITQKNHESAASEIQAAESEPEQPGLIAALTSRGITDKVASEFVRLYPTDYIQAKIEVVDWMIENQDKRISKSPAGYLVNSIRDDYKPPKGFVSRAERRRREEVRQAKEREAAEERRRKLDQDARERAEKTAINAYWESLTPEQQSELDVASIAETDPKIFGLENGPFKESARMIRRHAYIRRLLASRGSSPA